jgi:hypothetical protein
MSFGLLSALPFCEGAPNAPPTPIAWEVERAIPGFWVAFVNAANGALRASPGTQINSWWRSPSKNLACGGHPDSQHLIGTALDLASTDPEQWALRGFITVQEATHLHVQVWPRGLARSSGLLTRVGL